MFPAILIVFALVLALPPLTTPAPRADAQEPLQIVASFSILADIAQNVAGEAASVTPLMPPGSNPHAYSPSARDVATLSDADAVLVVGMNFEEGLLPVIEEAARDQLVVVSQCVPVRAVEAGITDPHAEDDDHAATAEPTAPSGDLASTCAAHHEAVAAAFGVDESVLDEGALGPLYAVECPGDDHEEAEVAGEEHEPGSCDPHVWTDPANAALWTLMIRDTLSALDPANAATYTANADAYIAELAQLDADVQAMIDAIPAEHRVIVTNHLTLSYFAHRYGLDIAGVVIPGGGTASEPSVQEVLALVETIQQAGVPAIFTETTVSPALAQQVADETGAQIVQLYTDSLSEPGGDAATYLDYIRYDASAFANALQ